jgi:hypothetical protein
MALIGTISPGNVTGFKNRIINGDISVAQRGTTFTNVTGQYTIDMWSQSDAGGFTANISQQVATTTENAYFSSQNFLRYKKNASVISAIVMKVEDLQQFNNKTFTLSYWAKSTDLTVQPSVTTYTVNDGSNLTQSFTQTYVTRPALSTSWQKYEVRYVFPNMYSTGFSGAHHLRLQFFDGATAGTFDIAEVQLEEGTIATRFEKRPFATELALCQRYLQIAARGTQGSNYSTDSALMGFYFPVQMRTNPSAGFLTGSTASIDIIGGSQSGNLAASGANGSPLVYHFNITGLSGRTSGVPVMYVGSNLFFQAEL